MKFRLTFAPTKQDNKVSIAQIQIRPKMSIKCIFKMPK